MIRLEQARRIALAAQGFAAPRPNKPTVRHLEKTLRQIALLQLDFVNVLLPAHFLIPFSRLGPYDRQKLHDLIYRDGRFTEQWAHEASIIPVETWPLLKHRMARHRVRPYGFEAALEKHSDYAQSVLESIRRDGPKSAADLHPPPPSDYPFEATWMGTFQRAVLEAHFGRGLLASVNRLANYSRVYDLAERRIPSCHHQRELAEADAQRQLIENAARAHGIATAHDLADYYRMNINDARPRIAELVASGSLERVDVETWDEPAYLHPEAKRPKAISASALLSPFDPVVWFRPRARRLFGFDYRIEIYTPEHKRQYGYYVLPFLQNEQLTARVDLKADRPSQTLLVKSAHHEPGAGPTTIRGPLKTELETLAQWLGLAKIDIHRSGNLARYL